MNIKTFALLTVTMGITIFATAQEENTNERLIDQLKNGTAPGMRFSAEKPAPVQASTIRLNEKESFITQIRKGSVTGLQFKSSTGSSLAQPLTMRSATAAPAQPLASEQPAQKVAQAKAEAVAVPKQE